jgi:hypothetical protein
MITGIDWGAMDDGTYRLRNLSTGIDNIPSTLKGATRSISVGGTSHIITKHATNGNGGRINAKLTYNPVAIIDTHGMVLRFNNSGWVVGDIDKDAVAVYGDRVKLMIDAKDDANDVMIDSLCTYPYMHIDDVVENKKIACEWTVNYPNLEIAFYINDTSQILSKLYNAVEWKGLRILLFDNISTNEFIIFKGIKCTKARYIWYQLIKNGFVPS